MGTIKRHKLFDNSAVLNIRNFPRHVRDYFKAVCAKREITVKDAIVAYMKRCIREDKL